MLSKATLVVVIALMCVGGCSVLQNRGSGGDGSLDPAAQQQQNLSDAIKILTDSVQGGASKTTWGGIGAAAVAAGIAAMQTIRNRNTNKKLTKEQIVAGVVVRAIDQVRRENPAIKEAFGRTVEEGLVAFEKTTGFSRDELAEVIRTKKVK